MSGRGLEGVWKVPRGGLEDSATQISIHINFFNPNAFFILKFFVTKIVKDQKKFMAILFDPSS